MVNIYRQTDRYMYSLIYIYYDDIALVDILLTDPVCVCVRARECLYLCIWVNVYTQ
jgi:hypothetical protein